MHNILQYDLKLVLLILKIDQLQSILHVFDHPEFVLEIFQYFLNHIYHGIIHEGPHERGQF